jgi:SAM-dependent methyltransferase
MSIPSTHGYYTGGQYAITVHRELVPGWLDFAALIRSQPSPRGGEGRPFRYLDLGCGLGYGLCLLAAAHPEGQFVGVDFLPAHIAHGRWLAAELGLANVRFVEADFLDLAADPSPLRCADGQAGPYAYVVAHGIVTWVGAPAQEALLAVASRALQPGGLFYCSYNTYPGWLSRSPFYALAQLELQRQDPADPAAAFRQAAARILALQGSESAPAQLAQALPSLAGEVQRIAANPNLPYLLGEFANPAWRPLYVGELQPRCREHGLSFLATATLPELFPEFLVEELRPVVLAEANPLIREALFDLAVNQSFRRDVFVKGPLTLPAPLRQEALAAVRLQPLMAAAGPHADYRFLNSFGTFQADPALCQAVEERLRQGACSLAQLSLALGCELEALLPGLVLLLDASRICLERGNAAAAALAPAQAANTRLRELIQARAPYGDLVAPGSGGSISFSFPEGLYLEVLSQGVPEPDWPICLQLGLLASGAQLVAEGVPVEDPQELQRRLAEGCALFRSERLPLLQALGALPAGD